MTTVGVDGGQSEIRLRVAGHDAVWMALGVTHVDGDASGLLVAAVERAWRESGAVAAHGAIDSLALGLTTLPSSGDSRTALARDLGLRLGAARVRLTGDAVTAHLGALPDGSGVVLVVGTGIACLGLDAPTGAHRFVDGDGFLLGDNGGSFWIGRRGLGAVLAAKDGRGEPTALTASSVEWFGEHTDLAAHLHGLDRAVNSIAQFAAEVQRQAAKGDAIARQIVVDAATELVATALAASAVVAGPRVSVAVSGRAAAPQTPLRDALTQAFAGHDRLTLVPAAGSPLDGALALAQGPVPAALTPLITEWSAP